MLRDDNPARPPAGVRLCALDEIQDPGSKAFKYRDDDDNLFNAFLVRAGDLLAGYVDVCPHAGWPLGYYGTDEFLTQTGEHIMCAAHGARFSLKGEGVGGCAGMQLTPWPVEVRDGVVYTA